MNEVVSYGRRISQLAAARPDQTAIIFLPVEGPPETLTLAELDRQSNQVGRLLAARGVNEASFVVVGLPKSLAHFVVCVGAWKLGACILPMNPQAPAPERDGMVAVANPNLIIADWLNLDRPTLTSLELAASRDCPDTSLPDRTPQPGFAFGSGGSTGRPKVIVTPTPWARAPGDLIAGLGGAVGMRANQIQLIAGALYHNAYFTFSHYGLFEGHTLVVLERFEAARAVDAMERYRVEFGCLVPTMMKRIIELPNIKQRDFASVQALFHTAAMCPPWLKRAWIELIGAEKLYEGYGSSEGFGNCTIRGDAWLKRPNSVGRPVPNCQIRIIDERGVDQPPGAVGLVYMKRTNATGPTHYYLGSPPALSTPDGFVTVGDLGWVDAEGYLYLADRRVDLIVSGGANIFPAEVEAALIEHPGVIDVTVIGLPDQEWGRRVHAIVQPADVANPPAPLELDAHCRARLVAYKAPKSYTFVEQLPRDEAGKIRRSALTAVPPLFEIARLRREPMGESPCDASRP